MSLHIDIKKSFPDFELSVQLDGGNEVFALLGASGCGKSLTLKCVAGIEKPDDGRIVINGETVFDSKKQINIPPQKRHVGFLFQNYALFPTMTVWNNIYCVSKASKSERASIVDDFIEKFHLEGVKNLYPRQISGGQQQRAALARILVSEPKILMLDEPFSALDTHLKWKMEQEVASVLSEFEGTTIFVSHNRDEAYRLSNKIAVMNGGKVVSTGTKEDVFDFPNTLSAALITGCKNISRAEKIDDFSVKALDWGITLKTEQALSDNVKYIGVHAHHFKPASTMSDEDNRFPCGALRIIDEPFEKVIIFTFNNETESVEKLQFRVPKGMNSEYDLNELILCVPPNKIMCID